MPEVGNIDAKTETVSAASVTGTGTRPADRSNGVARKRSGVGSADDSSRQLEAELDRVSLIQALTDTEAATARVIDLTERLVDARQQISSLRRELEELRIEHMQHKAEQERVRSSRAYRLVERIWSIRNALGF